jgi:hypothetical protein
MKAGETRSSAIGIKIGKAVLYLLDELGRGRLTGCGLDDGLRATSPRLASMTVVGAIRLTKISL